MKTYYEKENGSLENNGTHIPQGHRLYLQAEQEVADGEAEIIPFDHAAAEREQERATQLAEAHQFLADTDWYVIRQMDSGVTMPIEIRQERQACRDLIDVINSTV